MANPQLANYVQRLSPSGQMATVPQCLDVRAFGAKCNGLYDDTDGIIAAVRAAQYLQMGVLLGPLNRVTRNIDMLGLNSIYIQGRGSFSDTYLMPADPNARQPQGSTILVDTLTDVLSFRIIQSARINDVYFAPYNDRKLTTGACIKVSGCVDFNCENIRGDNIANGVDIDNPVVCNFVRTQWRGVFGTFSMRYRGPGASVKVDGGCWDTGTPSGVPTGTTNGGVYPGPGIPIPQGALVASNGQIYQAINAGGVTGAVAPSGIPGSGASNARTTIILDGTVQWVWVCNASHVHMLIGSQAGSCNLMGRLQLLNGGAGVKMIDDLGTGVPAICSADEIEIDHPFNEAFLLQDGFDMQISDAWAGTSICKDVVRVAAGFRDYRIDHCAFGNALIGHGVSVSGSFGHVNHCQIANNGNNVPNTKDGIIWQAGARSFECIGNHTGDVGNGVNTQRYGVNIVGGGGTANFTAVANNGSLGNMTAGFFDGSGAVTKQVGLNQ